MLTCFSAAEALSWAQQQIPKREARWLLAAFLGVSEATLLAFPEKALDMAQFAAFKRLVLLRARGVPFAYLMGEREFYGRFFRVTAATLIPRPETELLVESALKWAKSHVKAPLRILDWGTGSGAIAITLALELAAAELWASDISWEALAVARLNAQRYRAWVRWVAADGLDAFAPGSFELLVSNPPYVAEAAFEAAFKELSYEPRVALLGGADGLAEIRRLVAGAVRVLTPRGMLMLEHGYDQGKAVRLLLAQHGFEKIATLTDLAGWERVTLGIKGK